MKKWKIEDLITVDEDIIYECIVEDEESDTQTNVYLTNKRIIWISKDFVDSRILRFISKFGVFVGYEEYNESRDIGTGEYGVYFGDTESYETMWFYDEEVWKTLHSELARNILENQ